MLRLSFNTCVDEPWAKELGQQREKLAPTFFAPHHSNYLKFTFTTPIFPVLFKQIRYSVIIHCSESHYSTVRYSIVQYSTV